MTIRKELIQYACPICDTGYGFLPEKAGTEATCNRCNNNFTVPVGLPARMVDVSTDRGRTLTAEETAEFYNSRAGRTYLASQIPTTGGALAHRAAPPTMVPMEHHSTAAYPPPMAREDNDKPVQLQLGRLVGMKVDVDGKTRNAMATTFLGGLLVALGAIVMAKLGLKSKA